jgi:hypothetical protein
VLAILNDPDTVEVMTIDPEPVEEDRPDLLHGYRVRGAVRVPTPGRRQAVAQALVVANRDARRWTWCFDPNYAVRLSRAGQTVDFLICFWCSTIAVIGPGLHNATYPIARSAARVLRRDLRRGGVGWLWFWRRWLA